MKTKLMQVARTLCLGVLLSSGTVSALADDAAPANVKTASGTIVAVDAKDKVLKLRGILFSKTFILGDNCTLALANRKAASLADFQPGQQVNISYNNVQGVMIASQVAEQKLSFSGKVTALDPANHSLSVMGGGNTRAFKLPDNYNVVLNGDKKGVLDDIKLGSHVTVVYETPKGQWTAVRIEQPSLQFTGTLEAINPDERTISAGKKLIGDKQFHLAADCAIVLNGKTDGHLQDLRTGQNYELSYTTVEGVNIVNRIAPAPEQPAHSGDLSRNSPVY